MARGNVVCQIRLQWYFSTVSLKQQMFWTKVLSNYNMHASYNYIFRSLEQDMVWAIDVCANYNRTRKESHSFDTDINQYTVPTDSKLTC